MPFAHLSKIDLDLIFRKARSFKSWLDMPVSDALLKEAYALARMGPTSYNSEPMRVVFLRSQKAKEQLKPALAPGNIEEAMTSPVTAIVAYDTQFYEYLDQLCPGMDHSFWRSTSPEVIREHCLRNSSLQGAYLMIALRSVGLDCGPMSGFNAAKVDEIFFPNGRFKSNFLLSIGHGDPDRLLSRAPRLPFDEACGIF